jgi:hypothetical protein
MAWKVILKFHLKAQVCPATVGCMKFQVAEKLAAPHEGLKSYFPTPTMETEQ